jgi:hypothetical protein
MFPQLIKGLGGSEKVVISKISEMISQLAIFGDTLNISPVDFMLDNKDLF